jgi:MIF4G domain
MSRIDAILSLQTELRESSVSAPVSRSIQTVLLALAKEVETQGWKRVDWRGGGGSNSSSSGRGTFNKFRGSAAPPTGGAVTPPTVHTPPPKYISRFKKTDEADDAVLLLIQDKLNKFSPKNYTEIFHFLCQILDSGKTHFLKDFMKFVFQKATREETFCPYYAQLLCELTGKYAILLTEMVQRYREFGAIFDDISELDAASSYTELLASNTDKAYRKGYAQFLGELMKYNVLDADLFVSTLGSIIGNIERMSPNEKGKPILEEYVICLQRIIQSIKEGKTELANSLRKALKERFLSVLTPMSAKDPVLLGVTSRSRFTLMNIVDIIKAF